MAFITRLLAAAFILGTAWSAFAADNTLLIQLNQDGSFRLWHTEGATNLSDEELVTLAATARPEGGETIEVTAGSAHAVETKDGVMIVVPAAKSDKELLIDRDECGGVRVWHSDGATRLTDDQMTELVLTALPGGGKNVPIGQKFAKGFSTKIGVVAVLWQPVKR
ncbi:MAG TPA: hypothetical protein VFF82_06420 [Rhodocyclaceae bacterium]|nr:hypothetical protein [Rhodocyclaceae bacterium]